MPRHNKIENRAVYCLKVTLQEITPPIWRRFKVTNDITLNRLHHVIQRIMGWKEAHLHQFEIREEVYSSPDPDWQEELRFKSETEIKLGDIVVDESETFLYRYDLGDRWDHELKLEAILPIDAADAYPLCVAGERNCPPENCGGTGGYADLIRILKTPEDPQHQEMRDWLGGGYDPEAFSAMAVNMRLKSLRRGPRLAAPGAGRSPRPMETQ